MIQIQPLQPQQIAAVKWVIFTVCEEIWQAPAWQVQQYDAMQDIDCVEQHYFQNGGLFLVVMDGEWVIGSGAVQKLSPEICELKRMWLLHPYRGQGLGLQLVARLLDFARNHGYQKIRLDVFDPQRQARAIDFYQQLGFYEIDRYNNGPANTFMEKSL